MTEMTDDQIDFLLLTYVKPEDAERHGTDADDIARRLPVLLEAGDLLRQDTLSPSMMCTTPRSHGR